ncbi:MAG: hypothetical protein M3R39_10840 [Actinomycetota bacterium]|nr:hypothetical protein [Actinomycetota bacterium]
MPGLAEANVLRRHGLGAEPEAALEPADALVDEVELEQVAARPSRRGHVHRSDRRLTVV